MNRSLIVVILLFFAFGAVAQNSAITNAILYHKDNDLTNAKKEIDLAVANDKTKAEAKAWYYKGIIYSDISRSQNPTVQALSSDALKLGIEAFNKSKQLDAGKGEYTKLSDMKLQELWPDVINKGITEYEAEKLKPAQELFEIAQQIKPQDTTSYVYGSYAAEALNDRESLKKYTDKLVSLNHKSAYVYRNRIELEQDPAKKLEIGKSAVSDFKGDGGLKEILGDLYAGQGKNEEAIQLYNELITLLPNNQTLLLKIAVQYNRLKNSDKALEYYEKVTSINNANFLAHYNAAVIYFERGKEDHEKISQLNMSENLQKGKQMEDDMNKSFDEALKHANIALQLTKDENDIKDIKTMISEINKVHK